MILVSYALVKMICEIPLTSLPVTLKYMLESEKWCD